MTVLVAATGGRVVGYLVGRAVRDEGEILNLGVSLPARRRGVGRALVAEALGAFAAGGVVSVYLEVRASNLAAQRLYATFGFREVGRRRRYYRWPLEDAVVLRAAIAAVRKSAME